MRLYHHPLSSNARRAVMAAVQLGCDLELVPVDLAKGEQRRPEFLRMNPNGRVPVLDDGGVFLSESHAIMQYLAERTPGQSVYPEEPRARADVNRWLFWSACHFQPAIGILNWERVVKGFLGLGEPDPALVKYGEAQLQMHAKVLDGHLAARTWVAQDRLTLADLALAAPLMALETARLPVGSFQHLARWFARVQELDAWRKTSLRTPNAAA